MGLGFSLMRSRSPFQKARNLNIHCSQRLLLMKSRVHFIGLLTAPRDFGLLGYADWLCWVILVDI